ncbi:MAG: secretin N-terminal domain-containing protein [Gammaproteobacteria bacterium]|nr:secretin N-terminal domain-containing protein [Gammaproteobacteria bacterium]MBU1732583.1 secretin N-terminal domain-containing protein [Gammaproteobacteria bacterium]MBU1893446.1 secretin N-terminal domain-containing protein [Gammaproteobacteria bacterium]
MTKDNNIKGCAVRNMNKRFGWQQKTYRCCLSMALGMSAFLSGCASYPPPIPVSQNHLQVEPPVKDSGIPAPVRTGMFVPPPKASIKPHTFSVVVNEVPVKELLFALARDSGRNIDIYPTIRGVVSLNAIDETLDAILDRIVKQVDDLRYEIDGNVIRIMPDTPYLQTYRVNYVNIERETSMESSVDSTIAKTGAVATGGSGTPASSGNSLSAKIKTTTKSKFWELLQQNVKKLLEDTDKQIEQDSVQMQAKEFASQNMSGSTTASGSGSAGFNVGGQGGTKVQGSGNTVAGNQGSGAAGAGEQSVQSDAQASQQKSLQAGLQRFQFREKASVIANSETGMLAVRATRRQHQAMQEFLKGVLEVAKRQVLIEATIVEVELNNSYQGGIDWSRLASTGALTQSMLGGFGAAANSSNNITFTYATNSSRLGNIALTVKALETFGNIKVLSSPKLMALNNQTAVLQAVDNQIYFTVKVNPAIAGTATSPYIPATYETEPHSVAEGIVMTVTPQINESGRVGLTIRPTITRIIDYKNDPNPVFENATAKNSIPVLQVRTMESVLQVSSGQIVIMGGLMQEKSVRKRDGVPVMARLPGIGDLFSFRDDASKKSELVVFIRPTVIEDNSSAEQELMSNYGHFLPNSPKP